MEILIRIGSRIHFRMQCADVFGAGEEAGVSLAGGELEEIAKGMLDMVMGERNWGRDGERPIFFICHSLGVVLLKKVHSFFITTEPLIHYPHNCLETSIIPLHFQLS